VDVRRFAAWNSMAPGDVLSVGRDLVVWTREAPASAGPAAAGSLVAAADAAAPRDGLVAAEGVAARITPAVFNNDRIRQVTYVVRRGDSLSSIARRFRVSVAKLREWNEVSDQKYLQPGQRLKMYVNVTEQSAG
jgi:membrane-bound lytic murein transglycosylase D